MIIILAILAGFFAGLSGCLAFAFYRQGEALVKTDAERKRWVNKVLIRDGQAKLFPDSEIEPEAETSTDEKRTAPKVVRSPFQSGIQRLKEKISNDKKTEAGSNLPDAVKLKIADATAARQG